MEKGATECTFKFYDEVLKQENGFIMGRSLSVTFSDIYMVKMKSDIVIPSKDIFYWRLVEDIYSRSKIGENVLFNWLN